MESRACPVCRCTEATPLFDNRMLAIGEFDMSYEVGRCQGCGFHFAHRLPPASQYGAYYKAASKYDVASSVSALDRLRIEAAVDLMGRWIPKDHRVVDLGCGYGAMLAAMRDAGWQRLQGVDPAPQSALRARENFGLEGIHCGTLDNAHECVDLQGADLVCLMAVLEHLPHLRTDLEQLVARLRPGARLLVEVPAIEGFRADGAEPFGEFSIEHIQFFSFASLRNLLSSIGMQVIAEQAQDLPLAGTGSAFVLAERTAVPIPAPLAPEPQARFDTYIADSERIMQGALQRVPAGRFLVYGAGSHSARLLPRLPAEAQARIAGVVDGNANLTGKPFGAWTVQLPATIADTPELPILVSSFRAQNDIAASLRSKFPNPLVLLY